MNTYWNCVSNSDQSRKWRPVYQLEQHLSDDLVQTEYNNWTAIDLIKLNLLLCQANFQPHTEILVR